MIIAYFLFNSSLIYLADCLHVNYEQLILWLVDIYSHTWARPDPGSCKYYFHIEKWMTLQLLVQIPTFPPLYISIEFIKPLINQVTFILALFLWIINGKFSATPMFCQSNCPIPLKIWAYTALKRQWLLPSMFIITMVIILNT